MKNNIVTLLIAFLLVMSPASALTLVAQTYDGVSNTLINPSTVNFDGVSFTANPSAAINNVSTGVIHTIVNSAPGYVADLDELFFDANLRTCSGTSCTRVSGAMTTQCTLNSFNNYDCTVSSISTSGQLISQAFVYNPSSDTAGFGNFLPRAQGNQGNQTQGQNLAPTVLATVTPTSGLSPLVATFTNNVYDTDGTVASVVWNFGDGQAQIVQPMAEFSHIYLTRGTHTVTITATDNTGAQTQRTFSVVVDGFSQPPVPTLPFDDSVLFNVTVVTLNAFTDQAISPSNITLGGIRQTGTPYAVFRNFRSDTLYELRSEAVGFGFDVDRFFFDAGLRSCGTSCSVASRDVFGEVYTTQCAMNQFQNLACSVSKDGQTSHFLYNPVTHMIGIGNYLGSNTTISANQAPVVTALATPQTGASPLNVTFSATATDDGSINRTVWYFGDGHAVEVPASSIVSHVYNGAGNYTARFAAWDNLGLVTIRDFTISATGQVNGNNLPYSNQVLFNLTVISVDGNTGQNINPSTIVVGSQTRTGTPYAMFTNINSNTVWNIANGANGYQSDSDGLFFDFQLPSCIGATCSLVSRNIFGEVFNTQCTLNNFSNYDCAVSNNGATQYFLYNRATNTIGYGNSLVSNTVITNDNPPTIFVQANPATGTAPINVTFQNAVLDLDGVNSSIWFFGDGTSEAADAVDQVSHMYTQAGIYNAQFVTWDNNGIATQRNLTIKATLLNGDLPGEDDRLHMFIRSIRLPEEATPGQTFPVHISFENDGDRKLEDVKVIVTIPELGVRASQGSNKLYEGQERKETVLVELPEDTEPGTYWLRIQIKAGKTDRIIHREIVVGDL